MYARITPFKMKPGSKEAAAATMQRLKSDILGVAGMQQFINVMNDEGAGYVIAITEVAEAPAETKEQIQKIWANFAEYLEAAPSPSTFDVVADWSK